MCCSMYMIPRPRNVSISSNFDLIAISLTPFAQTHLDPQILNGVRRFDMTKVGMKSPLELHRRNIKIDI